MGRSHKPVMDANPHGRLTNKAHHRSHHSSEHRAEGIPQRKQPDRRPHSLVSGQPTATGLRIIESDNRWHPTLFARTAGGAGTYGSFHRRLMWESGPTSGVGKGVPEEMRERCVPDSFPFLSARLQHCFSGTDSCCTIWPRRPLAPSIAPSPLPAGVQSRRRQTNRGIPKTGTKEIKGNQIPNQRNMLVSPVGMDERANGRFLIIHPSDG